MTEHPHDQDTDTDTPDGQEAPQEGQERPQDGPETFPAEVVRELREEAARYRVRAKRADDYARQLFHARVAALGKLADPDDLEYSEDLVDDLPALEAAVDELIGRKPHLASRTPRGDIGQGATGAGAGVDLAALLRANS